MLQQCLVDDLTINEQIGILKILTEITFKVYLSFLFFFLINL